MKNMIVTLDKNVGKLKAKQYFMEICGYYQRAKVKQKQFDDSLQTIDAIFDNIEINAIISKYEGNCVCGDKLICDDIRFDCKALSQIDQEDILDIYIYLLTIGEINMQCDRVLYQVYYDMWQTAFVDVGRDMLKEYILNSIVHENFFVSDSFGPGFFGMPVTDTEKFFKILKADKIGMSLNDNGFMAPDKSYAGFFMVTRQEESLPSKDCENCISSGKTCSYCKAGRTPGPAAKLELAKGDLFKQAPM